jgi:hypothetical protein
MNDMVGINKTGIDRSACEEANCVEGSSCLESSNDAILRSE